MAVRLSICLSETCLSVDIDLTYIPLESREESLEHINAHLMSIAAKAKRAFPGMHIVPKRLTRKVPGMTSQRFDRLDT